MNVSGPMFTDEEIREIGLPPDRGDDGPEFDWIHEISIRHFHKKPCDVPGCREDAWFVRRYPGGPRLKLCPDHQPSDMHDPWSTGVKWFWGDPSVRISCVFFAVTAVALTAYGLWFNWPK